MSRCACPVMYAGDCMRARTPIDVLQEQLDDDERCECPCHDDDEESALLAEVGE